MPMPVTSDACSSTATGCGPAINPSHAHRLFAHRLFTHRLFTHRLGSTLQLNPLGSPSHAHHYYTYTDDGVQACT